MKMLHIRPFGGPAGLVWIDPGQVGAVEDRRSYDDQCSIGAIVVLTCGHKIEVTETFEQTMKHLELDQ